MLCLRRPAGRVVTTHCAYRTTRRVAASSARQFCPHDVQGVHEDASSRRPARLARGSRTARARLLRAGRPRARAASRSRSCTGKKVADIEAVSRTTIRAMPHVRAPRPDANAIYFASTIISQDLHPRALCLALSAPQPRPPTPSQPLPQHSSSALTSRHCSGSRVALVFHSSAGPVGKLQQVTAAGRGSRGCRGPLPSLQPGRAT